MTNQTPEQVARDNIDRMLIGAGWVIQDYKKPDLSAGQGIAVREVTLKSGRCDYLLLVDRQPVGVIEAKKIGTTLSAVAEQSGCYGENLPDFFQIDGQLPFYYESTGVETFFRDERDPAPRSRQVYSFHRPETMADWLKKKNTLRERLRNMPSAYPLNTDGMRGCQIEAIKELEDSFAEAHPRALIQMATGAGKTYTSCAFVHRLIRHGGAKRILFLVDRANLGEQAKGEFAQYVMPDTGRKFTEEYNVQHLTSNQLDSVSRVTICTIQRLYSMLRGEELDEDIDERSGFEIAQADDRPKDVAYNSAIPIEAFDFIVTDECHRSIYGLWRQVLEYFDAFLVGLTATPSKQTIGFFNQNLVTEYNYERAVADGVNVGYEVYRIKTKVTEQGGAVEKGFYVDKRHKQTRKVRWEQLDEELAYAANHIDRSVVVPSQIRTVLKEFKDALVSDIFPGRKMVPKTLIFAKDDSHAEDIVKIVRDVFGRGNDFAKKITYQSKHPETGKPAKGKDLIQQFRTSPQLRIAVTVDMVATGTDIKPLECILFMRDVRSRIYFEQMKGRGTRVLTPTDLQSVSGADARAKTHFVIVDAVGVCESDKTDSRPLERKRTVAFDKLMLGVALGKRDEDSLTSLAARLAKLEREITGKDAAALKELSGGKTLSEMAGTLLRSINPEAVAEKAAGHAGAEPQEVTEEAFEAAQKELVDEACAPFDKPALREALVKVKQDLEQIIDTTTIDEIIEGTGFDVAAKEKAASLVQSFRDYVEEHHAEIDALQILYSRPYKQRLTETMLKELEAKLKEPFGSAPVDAVWRAFKTVENRQSSIGNRQSSTHRFADLIPLVRVALEQQPELKPFAESVEERFNEWLMDKAQAETTFTPDQLVWLNLIRDHISTSLSIETDDFDYAPFAQQGGLGKAAQLFGGDLPELLEELNGALGL